MISKLWRCVLYRNFSNSVVRRDLMKKPADSPAPTESSNSSSGGFQMARMPTDFEKKILVYSGRFKTIEEIPKLVTSEMLDKAKTKIRIRIANIMILCTFLVCGAIIYEGKTRRKENIRQWQENKKAKEEKEQLSAAQAQ